MIPTHFSARALRLVQHRRTPPPVPVGGTPPAMPSSTIRFQFPVRFPLPLGLLFQHTDQTCIQLNKNTLTDLHHQQRQTLRVVTPPHTAHSPWITHGSPNPQRTGKGIVNVCVPPALRFVFLNETDMFRGPCFVIACTHVTSNLSRESVCVGPDGRSTTQNPMTKDHDEVRTFIKSNVSGLVKLVKNEAADSSTKAKIISWMAAVSSTCAKCTQT